MELKPIIPPTTGTTAASVYLGIWTNCVTLKMWPMEYPDKPCAEDKDL